MMRLIGILFLSAIVLGITGCPALTRNDRNRDSEYNRDREDRDSRYDRYDPRYDRERPDGRYNFERHDLLREHNLVRSANRVKSLQTNEQLERAAQRHAEWMAENDRFNHRGENGSSAQERVGSGFRFIAENIAYGYDEVSEVMDAWLDSPEHKRNILSGYYDEVGFGVAKARDGRMYWCAVYGG